MVAIVELIKSKALRDGIQGVRSHHHTSQICEKSSKRWKKSVKIFEEF